MSLAVILMSEKPRRRLILATLSLLVLFFAAAFAEADESEGLIQVKPVVEIDHQKAEIMLGDLIATRGVSQATLGELNKIRLADAPNPGETRTFTAIGLEHVFRPHLQAIERKAGEKIGLRVPTRVTVMRKSFRLTEDQVISHMKEKFKEICGDCAFDISGLTLPAVPTTIPAGSTWVVRTRGDLPKGSFSLPLDVSYESGGKRTYWITGVLAVRREMPVATRALQMGERLLPEDFIIQPKDITFATDVAATGNELASSIVARPIAAGQVIWRSGLRKEMAVKMGDAVKVVAGQDGWQVTIDGVAQGSAYIGDTLRVKIPRTQKMISGFVSEKGIVEVR